MEAENKKENRRLRLELFKRIWELIGIISLILITGEAFIKYYWISEQPSNFTILVIILTTISLNGKRKE